jgi:hypothetical protein
MTTPVPIRMRRRETRQELAVVADFYSPKASEAGETRRSRSRWSTPTTADWSTLS